MCQSGTLHIFLYFIITTLCQSCPKLHMWQKDRSGIPIQFCLTTRPSFLTTIPHWKDDDWITESLELANLPGITGII